MYIIREISSDMKNTAIVRYDEYSKDLPTWYRTQSIVTVYIPKIVEVSVMLIILKVNDFKILS